MLFFNKCPQHDEGEPERGCTCRREPTVCLHIYPEEPPGSYDDRLCCLRCGEQRPNSGKEQKP